MRIMWHLLRQILPLLSSLAACDSWSYATAKGLYASILVLVARDARHHVPQRLLGIHGRRQESDMVLIESTDTDVRQIELTMTSTMATEIHTRMTSTLIIISGECS